MSNAPINIILQKTGASDDHLVFTPDPDDYNLYHVKYNQHSISSTTTFTLTTNTIRRYLLLFFESIEHDTDGPEYVQFEVPTFPAMIVHAEDVPYYITTVVRQIEFLQEQEHWPIDNNPELDDPVVSAAAPPFEADYTD